jgi:tetratricopeptide (TPR) repeat protein
LKRIWLKKLALIVLAILGIVLAFLLIYQDDILGLFSNIFHALNDFLITIAESLTKFGTKQPISTVEQIIVGITYTLLAAFLAWIISNIWRRLRPHRIKRSDFPFRRIEARNILGQISSFPEIETSYIPRADHREASDLKSLAGQSHILLVGRMGVGKTRESAELIALMDIPPGQALVLKPEKTLLGTSFEWPTDIPLHQRRIILLLDNLNDFELYDENSDEAFQLKGNPFGFERVLIRLINVFNEKCDDLRVIATLRLETEEWKIIEQRTEVNPWREFHIHKLTPRTKSEAMSFTTALVTQIKNIELDYGAKQFLANRFDGTFASIRDFLRIKVTLVKPGNPSVLLNRHDVEDFIGRYPEDWETRFYKRRIEPNAAGQAIFEALGIVTKAHIPPYENVVIGLAARTLMLGRRFAWFQERRCRKAYRDLDLGIWITKRDSMLDAPDAYIEERGNLEERIDDLSNVLLKLSEDPTLSSQLYDSLLTIARLTGISFNRYDLSLKLAKRAIELQAEDAPAWIVISIAYDKLNQDVEALIARQRVVQLIPKNAFAWSYLAASLIKLENYDEAQKAIDSGFKFDPYSVSLICARGTLALKLNNADKAIEDFTYACRLEPSRAFAWMGLAQGYSHKNQFREAIRYFHHAVDLGIRIPDAWSGLGMSLKRMKRYSVAQKAFLCAIQLDPKHPLPWSHLAEILLEQQKLEESLQAYQQAVVLDKMNPRSWSGLGQVLNRLRQFDRAIKPHHKAIELGEDHFANQLGLGIAYYGTRRWIEAAQALLKSYNQKPSHRAIEYLSKVREQLIKLGEESLVKEINAALDRRDTDLDRNYLHVKVRVAINLAEAGSKEAAQQLCDQLAKITIDDWIMWAGLCSAYRKIRNFEQAIEAGKKAVRIEPNNSSSRYALGRAYEDAGDFKSARIEFEETIRLKPDHEKAIGALKRVEAIDNEKS